MPEVIPYAELLARLGSKHRVAVALHCGEWVRVVRGVYADAEPDLALRARAAALLLPEGGLVAGRSALWLHGLDMLERGSALEVVVPAGLPVPHRPGLLAREAHLAACDRTDVGGVPCLAPARAALDVVRRTDLPRAVGVLEAVLRAGVVRPEELAREVERARRGRGVVLARRALELVDPRAESQPESRLRVVLVLAGLPVVPQHEVRDDRGRVLGRLDLALVRGRIGLEFDGVEAHVGPTAFARDRQRQNELLAAGWVLLRFTAVDLRHPLAVVQRVRDVLALRAA